MRLRRMLLSCAVLFGVAPSLRAEYVALRNGQRLHVTGYQLLGEKYRLQFAGGIVEVPVEEVMAIEPEDLFAPVPAPVVATAPFREMVKAAAARYSVDADLIASVIAAESNFDPKAVSTKNARASECRIFSIRKKTLTQGRTICATCLRVTTTIWCWLWRLTMLDRSGSSSLDECHRTLKRFPTFGE
jgi:hypothetical protein